MKRKCLILILCLLLLTSIIPYASAAANQSYVVDNAWLLSSDEIQQLQRKAEILRDEYKMDVVILTVDSLDGESPQDYADNFYDLYDYGSGKDKSGLLFLVAMEERDWYISTYGDAVFALTDYGIQQVGEAALDELAYGEYAAAFSKFMDVLVPYLSAYRNGQPIDGRADYSADFYHGDQEKTVYYKKGPNLMISALVGILTGGVTVAAMRAGMNTKRKQRSAASYMEEGSFQVPVMRDLYLYSTTQRVKRQQNNSSVSGGPRGGGSSVHRSSSGRSHGGGGGKF